MAGMRGHLLPCAAAVVLLMSSAVAQVATNSSTASSAMSTAEIPSDGTSNTTASNLTTVDQSVPAFMGIRSCLPYNILVAAPDTSDRSSNSTDGRILITADYSVINSTLAAVENGILTLSLAGGFESHQPINFTVVVPADSDLRSVANAGSGLVVLGPGHNVTSLRLLSTTVGQIEAVNLTAGLVSVQSSGVLGGTLSGAIKRADITSTGTGSIAITSTTPLQLQVQLSGITTVVANIPQGSSITGTAGGLSKVQYRDGQCSVTSDTPLPFPVPSIFGGSSFGFGSASSAMNQKCQKVAAAQMQPAAEAAENPQWTCGVIVDGRLSCQVSSNATEVTWNITAAPTSPEEPGSITSPGANAANNTGSPSTPPASNAASPSVESIGVDSGGAANSATGANTASVAVEPPGAGSTGAGRRLFQLVNNPTNSGQITTGAGTTGPGSFASGTGSVSGPAGSTTQQTSSQGGSQPQTTISTGGVGSNIYNPVYVPGTAVQNIAAQTNLTANETAPPPDTTSSTTTTGPTTSISTSTSGGGPPVVRSSTSGPGTSSGIAVASTTCASKAQSLSMLVQPLEGAMAGSTAGSGARSTGSGAVGGVGAGFVDAGPSATAVSSATSSAGSSPLP